MEPKERPENRTVDLLGTFSYAYCPCTWHSCTQYSCPWHSHAIISFWLQLTRERPYR